MAKKYCTYILIGLHPLVIDDLKIKVAEQRQRISPEQRDALGEPMFINCYGLEPAKITISLGEVTSGVKPDWIYIGDKMSSGLDFDAFKTFTKMLGIEHTVRIFKEGNLISLDGRSERAFFGRYLPSLFRLGRR